jgi:membrane protein DedA with SNARE-associated domain/rhodanese-related sulfurtransferase
MLDLITHYGLALIFANVLIQQMGLPIPALPTLIVAGALAADGKIPVSMLFGAAFIACAISDAFWYIAGRLRGPRVLQFLCRMSLSPDSCVRRSEYRFDRWGRISLILAKFIPGGSMIVPPLAGTMRLTWWSFALLDGLGAALWLGVAIGAGMLFHSEIGHLIGNLREFETFAIGLVGVLLAGYIGARWLQRRRYNKWLRMARITVGELNRLMNEGQHPVVVDLRTPLARKQDSRFVPGALVMNSADRDSWLRQLPMDREIIFYCTCPNEAAAAGIARELMGLGHTQVRPLLGGFDAWVAAGYQVENRSVASANNVSIHAFSPATLRSV